MTALRCRTSAGLTNADGGSAALDCDCGVVRFGGRCDSGDGCRRGCGGAGAGACGGGVGLGLGSASGGGGAGTSYDVTGGGGASTGGSDRSSELGGASACWGGVPVAGRSGFCAVSGAGVGSPSGMPGDCGWIAGRGGGVGGVGGAGGDGGGCSIVTSMAFAGSSCDLIGAVHKRANTTAAWSSNASPAAGGDMCSDCENEELRA